jgi:hypothetical protein
MLGGLATPKVSNANDSHALVQVVKGECAPNVKQIAAGVCSDRESLDRLRQALNIPHSNPEAIIKRAKEIRGCATESCLFKEHKQVLTERFKPEGPWQSTKWLSNKDIDDVLLQYSEKFPRFKHVEFQMRDFEKQGGELARVNWPEVAKNYDFLGCVLNTDLSSGSGEHWTPFFVDFRNGTVEYFDSAGQPPLDEFVSFTVKVAHTLSKMGRKFTDHCITKVEHQKENTECGVYSLFYILSRLHGVSYKAFEYKRVDDNMMVMFRRSLFRNV